MKQLLVAVLWIMAVMASEHAIEPAHMRPDSSSPAPKEQVGFILPSFGVKVDWKPDAPHAEGSQKKPAHSGSKPEKNPQISTATKPSATNTATKTTAAPQTSSKRADDKDKKQKEEEEKLKKRKEEEAKKKKEEDEKLKKRKEEDNTKKKSDEEVSKKKREEDLAKKKNDDESKKKTDIKKTNELKNRRNRSPVPTKYNVPVNGGIVGVGGGALPDPGFVLEPGDLFQKAENFGNSVRVPSWSYLTTLVVLALLMSCY